MTNTEETIEIDVFTIEKDLLAEVKAFAEHLELAVSTVLGPSAPILNRETLERWSEFVKELETLPQRSRDATRLALKEGWFFGWHDSIQGLMSLVRSLSVVAADGIDAVMIDYYRLNLEPFAKELASIHPKRAAAIGAAVNAHLKMVEAGYLLSVPVFIAQADGIFAEAIGVEQPFRDGASIIKEKFGSDSEALDLLRPLLELQQSPFAMTRKARERHATEGWLNRHQVMHGERSDYGTEMNSLKAFSLLAFVGLHLPSTISDAAKRASEVSAGASPSAETS